MDRRKEGKSEGVIPSNVEHTGSLERPGKRGALKFRKKKNSRQCEDLATAKWRGWLLVSGLKPRDIPGRVSNYDIRFVTPNTIMWQALYTHSAACSWQPALKHIVCMLLWQTKKLRQSKTEHLLTISQLLNARVTFPLLLINLIFFFFFCREGNLLQCKILKCNLN